MSNTRGVNGYGTYPIITRLSYRVNRRKPYRDLRKGTSEGKAENASAWSRSAEIGSWQKRVNRVGPLISPGRFSLLFYDWISDSRESYRRREISPPPAESIVGCAGIKKSVREESSTGRLYRGRFIPAIYGGCRRRARGASDEFHVSPILLPLPVPVRRPSVDYLSSYAAASGSGPGSSVYAIDAFVHRAMSIIVCPSVCLFTE